MKFDTDDIRNIVFVGHPGAGKTSLIEALLVETGYLKEAGSIEKGDTVCDFEAEEKLYKHSLNSAMVSIDHRKCHLNLIDTPGYPDFIGQTLGVLPAADAVAVVINASVGIEFMTRRLMDWAEKYHYCRLIIINQIEGNEAQLSELLEDIQRNFGQQCIPINLPAASPGSVVDCFYHDQGNTAFSSVAAVHTQIIDQIVEIDEKLLGSYLESGEISAQDLHDAFEKALRENHFVPVCFVSAKTGAGIAPLLDIFERLMPSPKEGCPHPFVDKAQPGRKLVVPVQDKDQHVIAHVFKILHDPYIGKLGFLRVHQGTIKHNTQLFLGELRKPFKISHLYKVHGSSYTEMVNAVPGDICAIPKIDEIKYNAVLHNSHDEDHIHSLDYSFPVPVLGVAIKANNHGDEPKLADALNKLTTEDPCLVLEHNEHTRETILRGMGEIQLRLALEKLENRFHVDINTHPPGIAYRETITTAAEGHYRHKKQSGGAGQFGEVFLKVEPLPRGEGFKFINRISGGSIPGGYIPAVEKGIRQALYEGVLAGYPIYDVCVSVHDGKHHSVDSNEISFVTAGRKAFLNAVENANPILLEPIMNLEVTAPHEHMGGINGDLAARRGQITDTRFASGGVIQISAKVPLAELSGYHSLLKSITGGEGIYTMELDQYQQLPGNLLEKLIADAGSR